MRSGSRKNRPSRAFTLLLLLGAVAFAAGCSTAQSPGGSGANVNHILPSGSSVAGWLAVPSGGSHASTATLDYIAGGGSSGCTQCHGSDLSGGISRVSCFGKPAGCHHDPVANWATPAVHGTTAKQAPGSSGFASCQICHGRNFSGGGGGIADACADCHGIPAPHPARPWRGSAVTHTDTNNSNAPVCAQCHFTGSPNNPANHPATSAPAGTAPGCFNNTLCHGEAAAVPHPVDNEWVATPPAAQPHGNDAKAAPGDTTGFNYCKACHGSGTTPPANFGGGASGVSCISTAGCHGATAASPHPQAPWRGAPYTHTTTDPANAPVCYQCHAYTGTANPNNPQVPPTPAAAGTAPGCFNGTMCHNEAGHPAGWAVSSPAPQPHGAAAKKDATVSGQGYPYCQTCHGTNFAGGSTNVSCFLCHGAPHAPAPWRGAPYTHTDTDPSNAPACALCHRSPSAPAGTAPGCFNNTLCHGSSGATHAVPFNTTAHYSVDNTTFTANCGSCHAVTGTSPVSGAPLCTTCHAAGSPLSALSCTSCHASPPNGSTGAAYANIAGAHATHITLNSTGTPVTCNTCHNGLGSGTLNHYNRAKTRVPPGDAAFLATYNAQSGASSFDNSAALSCSNVSCHGGQATPNWQTGTLDVNTQCTNCHTDGTTAQFNGPSSSNHDRGPHQSAACTACHNTTTLAASHFTHLSTPALEGPASATIGGTGTLIPAGNYNAGSCTPSCHGNKTW